MIYGLLGMKENILEIVEQELTDPHLIPKICADRPIKTDEVFNSLSFYGHNYILKKYAQIDEPIKLKGIIPHGVDIHPYDHWRVELECPLPIVYYQTKEKRQSLEKFLLKKGIKKCLMPLAHPFLYVIKLMAQNQRTALQPREGSLFYLQHSIPGIAIESDLDAIADYLVKLAPEMQPVSVMLYFTDFNKKSYLPFVKRGLKVLSCGHMTDPLFHFRQYYHLSRHKYTISQGLGSCIFYAVAVGCEHLICNDFDYSVKCIPSLEEEIPKGSIHPKLLELLNVSKKFTPLEHKEILVDYFLGGQYLLSQEDLREHLLTFSTSLDRHGAINSLVLDDTYPNLVSDLLKVTNSQYLSTHKYLIDVQSCEVQALQQELGLLKQSKFFQIRKFWLELRSKLGLV